MEQRERQVDGNRCEEGEGVPSARENRMGAQAELRGRTVNEEAAGGFGRREKGRLAVREGLCWGGLTGQKRMLLLGWRQ